MVVQRQTMSDQAYAEIRQAILQGRLSPGTKLVIRPLTEELGLSPTPIKAALAALEREGLVESRPHHGYYVPSINVKDVQDICALRAALDRLAAELAAANFIRESLIGELDANLKKQRAAIRGGDVQRYADLNTGFHRAIWEASQNRRLVQAADNLLGQIRLLTNTSAEAPGRPSHSLHEHAEILRALRAGDAAAAGLLAAEHAHRSKAALLHMLGVEPCGSRKLGH